MKRGEKSRRLVKKENWDLGRGCPQEEKDHFLFTYKGKGRVQKEILTKKRIFCYGFKRGPYVEKEENSHI